MGLDMYLYLRKKTYVGNLLTKEGFPGYPQELKSFEEYINNRNFASIRTSVDYQVMYWRKANAIHDWFVETFGHGIDDRQDIEVNDKDLERLLDTIKTVLRDHSQAPAMLPTKGGFFFGTTDYDDWYYRSLYDSITPLENILKFLRSQEGTMYSVVYRASW